MKVNLLHDYRGVLTNELFYLAGEHDLPEAVAQALIDAGRAEAIEKQKPASKATKKKGS
jgi:hypothetical protein